MNLNLVNKNALIGGGSQGLGLASAIEIALMGANVTLVSRNEEKLKKAIEQLDTKLGQRHQYLILDYSDLNVLKESFKSHLENINYHIVVNNTGGPAGGTIFGEDSDKFLRAFSQHVLVSQFMAQCCVPFMKAEGFGRIINITSTSVRQPIPGLGVSNVTRAAMASWTKTLSNEIASFNITVNNVLPGMAKTSRMDSIISNRMEKSGKSKEEVIEMFESQIPAGRMGEPHEIGATVGFLASPAASYINGVSLAVDGGRIKSI